MRRPRGVEPAAPAFGGAGLKLDLRVAFWPRSIQAVFPLALMLLLWVSRFALAASCATPTPAPIVFARGATAAEETGGIPPRLPECWVLRARAGQHLSAKVDSPEQNVVFQIYLPGWTVEQGVPGGRTLQGAGEGQDATVISERLPDTGPYLIVLGTTRGGGEYRLHIEVH